METVEAREKPLSEIRVLDLADEKASFCSKLLADLGASVIKIEKPGGDPSRSLGPFLGHFPHPERSLFFHHHNTNKSGITLDIELPEGKELFLKLLRRNDVVVESFPPGYLKNLGFGFEILREINPRLILASVTGFGQNGPRSQYRSCDLVASAYGGQMALSGSASTPPLKPFGEQSYYIASLFAAIGILLALRKRAQSGKGEHIDISLQEAVVSTLDHAMVRYFYETIISRRQGALYWNNSFCIFPCKDGHILLTLSQQWETLVEWMDSEGMAEDLKEERWREEEYRLKNLGHIVEVLQRWTKAHTAQELFEMGQLLRFPWAPVYSPEEVLNSPQLESRGFFVEVEHPETGTLFKHPGMPYKFSLFPLSQWKRAPGMGEDNLRVYQEELGLSEKECQRLSSIGVI